MSMGTSALLSGTSSRTQEGNYTDCYVPEGRIGSLDLSRGCYTAMDIFRAAALDLAARGLADEVRALLRAGRHVRDFLATAYGCSMGPREYFTPSHLTGAEADAKDFLRLLGRAVGARKRTQNQIPEFGSHPRLLLRT
jgi:hypothetical protein